MAAVRRTLPAAVIGSTLNALIAAAALWGAVSLPELLGWFSITVLISAWLYWRRRKTSHKVMHKVSRRSVRRAVLLGLLSASPWAALPLLYLGQVPHQAELILIALCAGMAASGSVTLAPVYPAALSYLGLVIGGFAIKCAILAIGGHGYGLLALLTLSYAAFMAAVIATMSRLSMDHSDALRALTDAAAEQQNRKVQITQQNMRFETALNNMSQGLCFFDSDKRLIVCNRRYLDIYSLDPKRVVAGTSLPEIFDMRQDVGTSPLMDKGTYLGWREEIVKTHEPATVICELRNGRTVEIRTSSMPGGAWVATHDDITETRRLSERLEQNNKLLEHMATHDALTGLANRTLFRRRLDEAMAQSRRSDNTLALLLLDLNKFKAVNDTLGHPAGDAVLRIVSDRLMASVRPEEIVARLGGDEFAIILRTSNVSSHATSVAMRIQESVRAPMDLGNDIVDIDISIGIALLSPNVQDADELIKRADVALYQSKYERGGHYAGISTEPPFETVAAAAHHAA